jgi:acyl-CoA synthetase (AMP-forming)/AMP-acid ligase II
VWPGELTQWVKCAPLQDQYDLSSLRLVGYGGGVPPRELLDRYLSVTPRAFSGYGMTETSDAIMFTDPDALPKVLCEHNVGRPLDGVRTRLVSPDGEPPPQGEHRSARGAQLDGVPRLPEPPRGDSRGIQR